MTTIGFASNSSVAMRVLGGKPGAAILAVSALVATWIALFGDFVFFIDSVDFFHYAERLVDFRIGSYYDAIGYPLLICLTGFTRTGSAIPILVIQASFAALTPWLAFKTFAPFDRKAGIAAAVICLASLTPFFFQNTFFHDGASLFFGLLSTTFASMFFHFHRPRYIYFSAASAMYAYLTQPAAIGFFLGCWGAFALFAFHDRSQIKHVLAVMAIFAATAFGVGKFEIWAMRDDGLARSPSFLGRQIFFNEYLRGSPYAKFNGLAADRLRAALVTVFEDPPPRLDDYIPRKLARHEGHPAELVNEIFAEPDRDYFQLMWNIPDLSRKVTDRVFLSASLAFLYYHPLAVARYTGENLLDFAVGKPWHCSAGQTFPACRSAEAVLFYPALSHAVTLAPGRMPDDAYRFLTTRHSSQSVLMSAAADAWQWIYGHFRLALLLAMLLGWIAALWISPGLRWTLGAFVGAYAVNMTVFSFLVEPELRYQTVGLSMCAFVGGGGAYLIVCCLARVAEYVRSGRVTVSFRAGK